MKPMEYKRTLLYRQAQGKVRRDYYVKKITAILNNVVDNDKFLNLEKTDDIINTLKNKKEKTKEILTFDNFSQLAIFISTKTNRTDYYLLIDEEWKFCGIYKTNAKFSCGFDFNILQSDEIRIIDCNYSFQFQIDYDGIDIECAFITYR